MPTDTSTRNFLLQITLVKTSSPVVTRLLSVPPTVTFLELSQAIEASFGWSFENTVDISGPFPTFIVVKGNPFEAKETTDMESLLQLLPDGDGDDVNREDANYNPTLALVEVRKVLKNFRFRDRSINYDYDNGFIQVIQMLGRSADNTDGSIELLGGQGDTTQKTWRHGCTGPHKVSYGGPSGWELDLDEVRSRLLEVNSIRPVKRMKIASRWRRTIQEPGASDSY